MQAKQALSQLSSIPSPSLQAHLELACGTAVPSCPPGSGGAEIKKEAGVGEWGDQLLLTVAAGFLGPLWMAFVASVL